MARVLKDLDKFLNRNDMNIAGVASVGIFKKRVTKLEFTFNGEFKLKKLQAWTFECGEKSTKFKGKKLELENNQRTAVNLLVSLVIFQTILGILTLILKVPFSLAILHQVGAFFLLISVVYSLFIFKKS